MARSRLTRLGPDPTPAYADSLRQEFGDGTHLVRFQWTGGNTHGARHRAAAQLRSFLAESIHLYPRAHHFIVSHSHGGNVALYALQGLRGGDAVTGIVAMGTPFIDCEVRDFDLFFRYLSWAIVILAFCLICHVVIETIFGTGIVTLRNLFLITTPVVYLLGRRFWHWVEGRAYAPG